MSENLRCQNENGQKNRWKRRWTKEKKKEYTNSFSILHARI